MKRYTKLLADTKGTVGKYNYVYYRAGKAKAISRIVTFFLQFQNTGNLGLYFWQFSSMIGTAFGSFSLSKAYMLLKKQFLKGFL